MEISNAVFKWSLGLALVSLIASLATLIMGLHYEPVVLILIPFAVVILYFLFRNPLDSAKRLVMIFYGHRDDVGVTWWICGLGFLVLIIILKGVEYPVGMRDEILLKSVTTVNFLTTVGMIIFISPAIILPLGRKFVERPTYGTSNTVIEISSENNVTKFGSALWKEPGYTYKELPIYLDEQKYVSMTKELRNLKITVPFQVSVKSKPAEKNNGYYKIPYTT